MFDLTDLLARRAELTRSSPALTELESGRSIDFAGLSERAGRAAAALAEAGVTAGERVAILCRNRIDFFVVLFACARLGAVLAPLNWRAPEPELAPLIDQAQPRAIVCGSEDLVVARALADRPGCALIDLDDAGPDGFAARLAAARPPFPFRRRWPGDDIWYLLYTSGTTGKPKAVIQTYRMALVNAFNVGQAVGVREGDTTLNFLPLFHTAGINLHTLPTLFAGGQALILPGFDCDRVMAELEAGRIDTFFGVPAIYQALSLHPRFESADLTRVRHWGCGGAPLPDALARLFAGRGAIVCNGMGMTETGPTVFLADRQTAVEAVGSVGRAQILSEARIARPDGSPADTDEAGELWISGPGITPGYWNDPDATAAAFAPGGWLRTGDLARRDADGRFWIVGRLKEMFISGGENVYPAEVENVLAGHPEVLEAAVLGVPDPRWGEVGIACFIARDGCDPQADALAAHCRARLAAFKVPKRFVRVDDFPRTAAGKVRKHLIALPNAPEPNTP